MTILFSLCSKCLTASMKHMNRFLGAVLPFMLFSTVSSAQTVPQLDLPRVTLSAGLYRIETQIASTPRQRQIGLMWREEMPDNEGMLFVFEQSQPQCFWMKNTVLPLSAAFIEDDGTIVNIADMAPQTTDSHCSQRPVRYVLEMHQGWFAQHHITSGASLRGPMFTEQP